jgi:flagellar assembly protein FliH
MAKNVFRPTEVKNLTTRVQVIAPEPVVEEAVEELEIPEYTGPTADDLRREAEAFRQSWEEEKQGLVDQARAEAANIIQDAEQTAFDAVKAKTDESERIRQQAEDDGKRVIREAEARAADALDRAEKQVDELRAIAERDGHEKGRIEGFEEGNAEVTRLVEQLHSIINHAIEKRNEIIEESETQLINLVILIARKVVKVISENQKNVVINNVIQALRKLKSRGEVIIRVNLEDVDLTSEHVKDFMRMVEQVKSITVVEDSSVDRGGCVLETDFGQIDARISSQLHEIEERIVELVPIRIRGEG